MVSASKPSNSGSVSPFRAGPAAPSGGAAPSAASAGPTDGWRRQQPPRAVAVTMTNSTRLRMIPPRLPCRAMSLVRPRQHMQRRLGSAAVPQVVLRVGVAVEERVQPPGKLLLHRGVLGSVDEVRALAGVGR